MADDPAALGELEAAVAEVRRVFARFPGSAHWGDGLPHHPGLREGPVTPKRIVELESRPARLPAAALSWEEVNYFFSHAGYRSAPKETLPPALRYFLPRLAEWFLAVEPPAEGVGVGMDGWLVCERLDLVRWWTWPAPQEAAIRRWLIAWTAAALRWQPQGTAETWWNSGFEDPSHRDAKDVLSGFLAAGAGFEDIRPTLDGLTPLQMLRFIRGLMPYGESSLEQGWPFNPAPDGCPQVPVERQRPLVAYLLTRAIRGRLVAVGAADSSPLAGVVNDAWDALDALAAADRS